jgi:hypothetical protein
VLAGRGHGGGGQKVRGFRNGADGFEQGTSKVENSSPWYNRADIQSKGIFLQ